MENMENENEKISNETAQEIMVAMMERQVKRLFILCIIIFIAFVGSNVGWLIYESQFETVVLTQDANTEGGGDINLNTTGIGDVNLYGESEADNQSP